MERGAGRRERPLLGLVRADWCGRALLRQPLVHSRIPLFPQAPLKNRLPTPLTHLIAAKVSAWKMSFRRQTFPSTRIICIRSNPRNLDRVRYFSSTGTNKASSSEGSTLTSSAPKGSTLKLVRTGGIAGYTVAYTAQGPSLSGYLCDLVILPHVRSGWSGRNSAPPRRR